MCEAGYHRLAVYDVDALVEEPALLDPLKRSVLGGAPPAYLRSVKFKLTARCNLKCVMCRYGRGWTPPELPTQRFLGILDEVAQQGCRKVHFSGGEVLVRPDFEVLVGRAADLGLKVTLTSNLTLLTRDRAKALMRHKISSISTSLDGARAKTHEAVRRIPGSFKRTLKAMRYIARERERRGRRTRLRVNFVMLRQNFHEYPALIQLAADLGVTDIVPMPVDTKKERLRLTKGLIQHYNREIAPAVLDARQAAGMDTADRLVYPFGRDKSSIDESTEGRYAANFYRQSPCYAPFLHMFVAWDGKVYLCCMTNGRIEPLGDLTTQSVAEVFTGSAFQAIRAEMMKARLPYCHACDMFIPENERLSRVLPVARLRSPS